MEDTSIICYTPEQLEVIKGQLDHILSLISIETRWEFRPQTFVDINGKMEMDCPGIFSIYRGGTTPCIEITNSETLTDSILGKMKVPGLTITRLVYDSGDYDTPPSHDMEELDTYYSPTDALLEVINLLISDEMDGFTSAQDYDCDEPFDPEAKPVYVICRTHGTYIDTNRLNKTTTEWSTNGAEEDIAIFFCPECGNRHESVIVG